MDILYNKQRALRIKKQHGQEIREIVRLLQTHSVHYGGTDNKLESDANKVVQ